MATTLGFPEEVAHSLKYYVYRLVDPRSGTTFYVGKGKDNRAFQHIEAAKGSYVLSDDAADESKKVRRIWALLNTGLEPVVIIHRHGLDEATAFQVESALIDAYDCLNDMPGHDRSFGIATPSELIERYGALPATIIERAILINIRQNWEMGLSAGQLYNRTRRYWKINPKKHNPQYGFAVANGIIREIYWIDAWDAYVKLDPEVDHWTLFDAKASLPNAVRYGFRGKIAHAVRDRYIGKSVRHYQSAGSQNPIRYLNCEGHDQSS